MAVIVARDVVLESRAHDPAGRLASEVDPLSGTSAYSYDTAGRTARVDYGTGGASRELGYDTLRRPSADTFRGPSGLWRSRKIRFLCQHR
ncbi:RHS repeat domain-containing protein [Saccharopolyspora shandongensis]|uniref:RHS repeat domain-containing protein n=1 Tax=Saccharopolyspora shandongensis TaxID=418495 RepID=UPI0033CA3301